MSGRPQQTPQRPSRRRGNDHRLHPIPDWQTELLAQVRRQHDTTSAEEGEDGR
jgi:hypothetical protein